MATKCFFKIAILCSLISISLSSKVDARTVLKNICNIKGQEEIILQGRGLVVGLNGTGDGSKSLTTLRAVAQTLSQMGAPIGGVSNSPSEALKQLKELNPKNIAEVFVKVTVPKDGASRTDKLDVEVSAIRAKSLKGGSLLMAPLLGPTPTKAVKDRLVYAHAYGKVEIEKSSTGETISETIGVIHDGARMKIDLQPTYVEDGKITIVLTKNHAGWSVAADISELINTQFLDFINGQVDQKGTTRSKDIRARAMGPRVIQVPIPKIYQADPKKNKPEATTAFVREILSLPIPEPKVEARIVVNRRTGTIVISGDIEIGSTIVGHKSIIATSGDDARDQFFLIDPSERALSPEQKAKDGSSTTQLASLLKALKAVKVPNEDVISILQALERSGKLHGKLILQ